MTTANTAGATLNLNGFNETIGSLTGGGTTGGGVTLGAGTLTLGTDNTSPAAYAGIISGTGGLTKTGTGTETLSGNSTYTGATVINGGTLTLSGGNIAAGELGGSPTVTVNSGGILNLTNQDTLGFTTGKEALVINSGGIVQNNATGKRDTLINTLTMTGGTLAGYLNGRCQWRRVRAQRRHSDLRCLRQRRAHQRRHREPAIQQHLQRDPGSHGSRLRPDRQRQDCPI